jgi:hypothetical protein
MQLRVDPSKLISEVQSEFNQEFPFLKLVFFQYSSGDSNVTDINRTIPGSKKIGDYQAGITDSVLDIHPAMKVSELEKLLKDKFRLNTQVFRRSGKLWLQTTMTDNWSLAKQNEHGLELSRSSEIYRPGKNGYEPDNYA